MPFVPRSPLLGRGVWQAPFFGPDGEMVLLAVDRRHNLIAPPLIVPHGASRIAAADGLVAQLDALDSIPNLRVI